jgi:asparagine synthase (glutamine-hydrolysing)
MSAVTGLYYFNKEPISVERSRNLMKALEHFPADDIQTWQKENLFFGCHAQWITPESIGERLPYYDQDRKLVITADAIIDNRSELFDRLQVETRKRKLITDSELILLSYHKWGEDAPKYLIGDFAFMIWDERKCKLFGARDFSGGRTLYFYRNQKCFAFCTTIQPLFTLPFVKKQLNEQWLAEFLAISAVVDTVDVSITPYLNIEQLPPAHSISVSGSEIRLNRYCTLLPEKTLKLKSDEEYVEAFQDVFKEAVRARMRTFREVGSHLSGGLDSGSVVSFAAEQLSLEKKQLHTFSYIPPKDFKDFTPKHLIADERPFIKLTVDHIGSIKDHYLDFNDRDPFSEIDDFLKVMEMPYKFFENSFWLKGMFEKAAEEDIGVLLNGGRGNLTISWGSALDYYSLLLKKFRWAKLLRELDQYCKNVGGPRLRRLPIIARIAFPAISKIFSAREAGNHPALINPDFAKRTGIYKKLETYGVKRESGWFSNSNVYQQRKMHFKDVFHWNATNTLATKFSLRYSLWERDPTNDLRVIRFCLSLPEEQYVRKGLDRALIRRATEKYLPNKVRLNQRIRGVQGADWLHRIIPNWHLVVKELQELTSDKQVLEFLNGNLLNELFLKAKGEPKSEYAANYDYRIIMRSIIVFRFIKKNF